MQKIIIDDTVYSTQYTKKYEIRKSFVPDSPKIVRAFIPGTIREINVVKGQTVKRGDKLLILEAMKMMNQVNAMTDGKIREIKVNSSDVVTKNQILLELE